MGSAGFQGNLVTSLCSNSIGAADTMLNGMTAATVKDFIRGAFGKQLTEAQQDSMTKYICLGYGLLSIGFMYFISDLESLLLTFFSIVKVTGGIGLGAFTLGAFFPWANVKGLIGGTISSIAYLTWITYSELHMANYDYSVLKRHFSVNECINNGTLKIPAESVEGMISPCEAPYAWQTSMSVIIFIITGIIISGLTGFQDPKKLDQQLLCPSARYLFNRLPSKLRTALNLPYYDMKEEMEYTEQKK